VEPIIDANEAFLVLVLALELRLPFGWT